MRSLASSLVSLALIASASAPLAAQHLADSATVGRWYGRAQITVPWTARRTLDVRLDIQPDGGVSGTIGDALLDAHIYRDSPFARAVGLARKYVIEGRLIGAIIRPEGVLRERVRLSLDCAAERITGELQTSGEYDGPVADRLLTARVTLERVGPVVATRRTTARDARPRSP